MKKIFLVLTFFLSISVYGENVVGQKDGGDVTKDCPLRIFTSDQKSECEAEARKTSGVKCVAVEGDNKGFKLIKDN